MQNGVTVENIGKQYCRYHTQRPLTFMEAALSGFRNFRTIEQFWPLRHVDFTVKGGDAIGIIGQNGAGKSTLLHLLGGVGKADEGRIVTNGKIGALFDLGANFHGELTGRENVHIAGVIAGMRRHEVRKHFDSIVTFAELDEFIDNPVRTFSAGMHMRLAFSVAVHTNPDILLVDECLSVGDLSFIDKCRTRIAQLKDNGCAIVVVSHDLQLVADFCEQALWLEHGQIVEYGIPEFVTAQYVAQLHGGG